MTKQVLLALGVLIILIISQVVWFNQLWEMDKQEMRKEIATKTSDIFSFQSLSASMSKDSAATEIKVLEKNDTQTDKNSISPVAKIEKTDFTTDKTIGNIVEKIFLDYALDQGIIKLSFVDSIFRKSYPRMNDIANYSFYLMKNKSVIDSLSYFKKRGVSTIKVDLPLGRKKMYKFIAFISFKPSAQIRNILFSIGITSVAIILVAVFMIFQLLQLRKRTLQLQFREKSVNGIIHDLKSPLSYIYTMLGFFESTEKDTLKQQNLNTAKTRVKYLSEKIELLLSVFKADSGRLVMNKTPYNFSERCTELMEELKLIYKDKQITYNILSPDNLNLNVDNVYFEGCVRNLLDNAVKYSPENAEITVSSEQKNNQVFLYFKDNGAGIPKELHKKVFKEFYRKAGTENVKGHGVGLSFTKQIVEAHKGKIYIKKQKDEEKGTTFVVELVTIF